MIVVICYNIDGDDMITFGERIKEIRELKGFPQKHVADFLNLQRSNYSKIENNHQNMTHKQLKLFCEFFDVSANYLLGISPGNNKSFTLDKIEDVIKRLDEIKDTMIK